VSRTIRGTAASLGKSVNLQIDGAEVELDREMIEVLRDPLVHIIRNSIDHGIESPEDRRTAGKRENGRLSVAARQSGNQIVVEVADDGRGIDTDRLIRKLADAGRDERALRALGERAKLDLVFEPGLSSKDEVSEISGRGVGMDVVRAAIEQIGGRVDLDSQPGKGLRILIRVPLTLSIIPTIVVAAAGQRFAVPRQAIEEIVSESSEAIRVDRIGSAEVVTVRDRRLPLVELSNVLEIGDNVRAMRTMLAIVSVGEGSFALRVDDVLDNEELVIKPAAPAIMATGLYAGQTLPDSGRPMLLLDCGGIARDAGLQFVHDVLAEEADDIAEDEVPGVQALVFIDLDGTRRAVPLGVVDRIEQVDGDSIRHAAGRLRLTIDGRIIPLAARCEVAHTSVWSILRLKDGVSEIGYAIAEAADIVTLPAEIVAAGAPGPIAGAVLLDDEPVELLDPHWLFAEHGEDGADPDAAPLCLLTGGEDGWMRTFIQPMLETAGYRVTLDAGSPADIVLTLDSPADTLARAPVVRLRSKRGCDGDGSIWRYDRDALLGALASVARGK